MAANTQVDKGLAPPKKGDTFCCRACGMALEVTKDCCCDVGEQIHFHCCGQEMSKV